MSLSEFEGFLQSTAAGLNIYSGLETLVRCENSNINTMGNVEKSLNMRIQGCLFPNSQNMHLSPRDQAIPAVPSNGRAILLVHASVAEGPSVWLCLFGKPEKIDFSTS